MTLGEHLPPSSIEELKDFLRNNPHPLVSFGRNHGKAQALAELEEELEEELTEES